MINEWAASRWFAGRDPIGARLQIDSLPGQSVIVTIVGVVKDNRARRGGLLLGDDGSELYRPFAQSPSASPTFFVRLDGAIAPVLRPMRAAATFVAIALVVLATAVLAAVLPAVRASRVSPLTAMRTSSPPLDGDPARRNGLHVNSWLIALAVVVVVAAAGIWYARRAGRRALMHHRARVDRFKLASRKSVRERLLNDAGIHAAVAAHAKETGQAEAAVWKRVDEYVHEIVPFFNVVAYYQLGYRVSEALLNLFYKVTVEYEDERALHALPRDSVLVYLMNHRSNADYILVSYALVGEVALSYAVGEWARAFPLEHMFKAFGSYFVRRKYREPLYHAVLERYVQLITREGVTQGIFLEGGLTRDGKLKPPKIGLLDYVLGIARDPAYRGRIHIVPVAVNYDRVLEDRSLLRELATREGRRRPSRLSQFGQVAHYVWWNSARLVSRRWKRYGRAAVIVGAPMSVAPWFDENPDLFELPRVERLSKVQTLCDGVMSRIGALVPVTPVSLACAAIQSFDRDFIPRIDLLERMAEMQAALVELNGRVVRQDRAIEETFERAYRMLRMRRVLVSAGDGYAVLPKQRELVSYYANSIAHLLGPFEDSVRKRDALPTSAIVQIG